MHTAADAQAVAGAQATSSGAGRTEEADSFLCVRENGVNTSGR